MKLDCKLYRKITTGEVLTEEDYRELGEIVKEVLSFMANEKIIPSPQNYERWFKIFCYVRENNLNLSKAELIDLYLDTYHVKDIEKERSAEFIDRLAEDLYEEVQRIIRNVSEHNERISKGGTRIEEMASEITNEDLHKILEDIMHEVKGLKNINKKFMKKLEKQREEIRKLREELKKVKEEANVDPLTGLRNRRSFERALQEFFKDFKRYGYPFSLIMLDLDNFKNINDTYGHLVGDRVLREIGNILRNYLRAKDIPARTGGEEFTIILPGIRKEDALKVAERLRRVLENHSVDVGGRKINVTASFGVVEAEERFRDIEDMLREVDAKLYSAKRKGKNRVEG
jgi:diguanylate cyclase